MVPDVRGTIEFRYDIPKGEILLDGVNIEQIPLKALHCYVAVVVQDVFLVRRATAITFVRTGGDIQAQNSGVGRSHCQYRPQN